MIPLKPKLLFACAMSSRGERFSGGAKSVDLQQVLLLGHTSDLLVLGVQHALRALHKWRASRPRVLLLPHSCFLTCLQKAVLRLGGSSRALGVFQFGATVSDTASSRTPIDRLAHNLRQFWRLRVADRWLASSRRDAAIARDAGFSFTESCVNSLRSLSRKADGHARQVMCGGLAVEAHATHTHTHP